MRRRSARRARASNSRNRGLASASPSESVRALPRPRADAREAAPSAIRRPRASASSGRRKIRGGTVDAIAGAPASRCGMAASWVFTRSGSSMSSKKNSRNSSRERGRRTRPRLRLRWPAAPARAAAAPAGVRSRRVTYSLLPGSTVRVRRRPWSKTGSLRSRAGMEMLASRLSAILRPVTARATASRTVARSAAGSALDCRAFLLADEASINDLAASAALGGTTALTRTCAPAGTTRTAGAPVSACSPSRPCGRRIWCFFCSSAEALALNE